MNSFYSIVNFDSPNKAWIWVHACKAGKHIFSSIGFSCTLLLAHYAEHRYKCCVVTRPVHYHHYQSKQFPQGIIPTPIYKHGLICRDYAGNNVISFLLSICIRKLDFRVLQRQIVQLCCSNSRMWSYLTIIIKSTVDMNQVDDPITWIKCTFKSMK